MASTPIRAVGNISGRILSPTEAACFESHRKAWQAIVDSAEPHGVVLEDDLVFATGFSDCLSDDWTPPPADIIKLETWGWRVYLDRAVEGRVAQSTLHRLRSTHIGGGGYILSQHAATILLKDTENFVDPVDQIFFDVRSALFDKFVTLQAIPALVVQGGRHEKARNAAWVYSSLEEGRAEKGADKSEFKFGHRPLSRRAKTHLTAWLLNLNAQLKGQKFLRIPFE